MLGATPEVRGTVSVGNIRSLQMLVLVFFFFFFLDLKVNLQILPQVSSSQEPPVPVARRQSGSTRTYITHSFHLTQGD